MTLTENKIDVETIFTQKLQNVGTELYFEIVFLVKHTPVIFFDSIKGKKNHKGHTFLVM